MLTSLEIENFKGIAARQRVEFAPLTLLFGANSAGKSTILQALLYLHELIERGSADVDRTELGGDVVELGGFARLVHRHETRRSIVLRAEFATPGGLERLGRDVAEFPFPDLDDEVESAWLELTVVFRGAPDLDVESDAPAGKQPPIGYHGPVVERAVVGVNGDVEPLVWLELGASLREGEPLHARVNLGHPLLATETRENPDVVLTYADGTKKYPFTTRHAPAEVTEAWEQIAIPEDVLHRDLAAGGGGYGGGSGAGAGLGDGSGFGDGRSLPVFAIARHWLSALPPPRESLRVIAFGDDSPEKSAAALQVRTFLEMAVLGTTTQLASFLRDAIYVGPLRAIPAAGDLYERPRSISSWADGLASWQALLADRGHLVADTNSWLGRLGAECRVFVTSTFEPSSSSDDTPSMRVHTLRLETPQKTRVLPAEVGAGISQLMPVVVASLQDHRGMLAIEQPELHVHPALQVGLGDLFIETVSRARGRRLLLIETHSEHLILRLLRRIRETTEKELAEGAPPFTDDKLSVLYVEPSPEGVRVRRLRVDERGEFVDPWPKGFFDERFAEIYGP